MPWTLDEFTRAPNNAFKIITIMRKLKVTQRFIIHIVLLCNAIDELYSTPYIWMESRKFKYEIKKEAHTTSTELINARCNYFALKTFFRDWPTWTLRTEQKENAQHNYNTND